MGKKLRKFLAVILSIGILASVCAAPLVSAVPAGETYDDYDVITYEDLHYFNTQDPLPDGGYAFPTDKGDFTFTYNATSASHSAIYKMRLVAGDEAYFQIHASSYGGTNNFAYRLNGTNWQQRNPSANAAVGYTINAGDIIDFEVARLLVTGGENTGKYYTYFKVDGNIIFEKYAAADDSNTTGYLLDQLYFNKHTGIAGWQVMDTPEAGAEPLKFGSGGKFKAVIFSDIQENTSDQNGIARLVGIMERAIEYENPDLIILLGDNTELNIKDPEDDFRALLTQILAPIVNAGVPYAFVFGNHDDQSYYSGQRTDKDAMLAVYQSIGDCRTTDPDPSLFGTGTCKIPIYASGSNDVAFDLFMVDSNTYQNPITASGGYDNPHADQLAWMAANKDAGVNSLVFQHIPMPEYYNLLVEDANGEKTYGGKKYAKALNANATGHLGEFPCPPNAGDNTGEFAALKSMGGVLGVFTGHDHLNDYTGTYDGINLTAVPGMTYFNYGDEEVRGYGVIDLNESNLSTYDYHTVKFSEMDALLSPYAFNLDFSGGNSIETSGNAAEIANTGSTVTYKFDDTLKKTVASFDGTSGYGYTLSETARDKMRDGYTYEILYKLPSVPGGDTDLASGMYSGGFGTEYKTSNNEFRYWQSFNESQEYRQLYYGSGSKSTGSWIHIAAVWDPDARDGAGQLRGFLNGAYKDYSNPGSKELKFNANGEFYVGGNSTSGGNFRDGTACDIAFVRIHDKAYSDSEVADLYTAAITPGSGAVDGKYYPYDEITYSDLRKDFFPLDHNGFTFGGGNVLTYDATSPSFSAKLKFRWTAGSNTGIQFSFDKSGTNSMSYPFGVWVKKPNSDSAGANGAWHLKPTDGNLLVNMDSPVAQGDTFDIELGRLKVVESDAQHGGQYYVYLKVNGELIKSTYSSVNANGTYTSGGSTCRISNQLVFDDWGSTGNKISASPEAESYADYDEIYYSNLYVNGTPVANERPGGGATYTYNKTSESGSVVLKLRYIPAGTETEGQISFDRRGSNNAINYMFGVQIYKPTAEYPNGRIWLRPGYGPSVGFDEPLVAGNSYDIEFARLKVATGLNAGKYYMYFKMNDVLLAEDYVAANVVDGSGNYTSAPSSTACSISNEIYITFWGGGGATITNPAYEETYESYDEVYYSDLYVNGNPVPTEKSGSGTTYTYNKTSASGSAVLKLRWKAANPETQFQISFDKKGTDNAINYMFGMQLYGPNSTFANGYIWLRPGYSEATKVGLSEAIQLGQNYDIEFARLKVATGPNAGKYYMYFKMNDVLLAEDYVAANVVDSSGNYTSNPGPTACRISNEMYITFWGGGGATITNPPYNETYDSYDEVNYEDLLINGNPVDVSGMDLGATRRCTYNATSPSYSAVLKFRWTAGAEAHVVLYFDAWDPSAFPFCLAIKKPGYDGLGAAAGANGAWHIDPSVSGNIVQMSEAVTAGETRDIEYGRLKVMTGPNAGKYYVYLKVDEVLVSFYYYGGVSADGTYKNGTGTLSNNVLFTSSTSDNFISATPVPYEPYDEVGYDDLRQNGKPLAGDTTGMSCATVFTYNRTSPTGSAIFKYRWKVGSVPKFQLSFDKTASDAMAYMFGAWLYEPDQANYPQGKLWLRPSYGPEVNLVSALTPGSEHNVEFARLKISTGPDRGKYYVYIKIDNVLIAEDYVAASVVDKSGDYTSDPGTKALNVKSGEIIFTFWGSEGNTISTYKKAIRGDFNSDNAINVRDLESLRKAVLGFEDASGNPAEIADFDSNGTINVIDLVVMKKHITATNSYSKTGSLNLGTQEHLLESNGNFVDNTKTASYIAAASAVLGANSYRLSMPIHNLYYASGSNGVIAKDNGKMAQLKGMVAALKAQGINEILYVTDSFILPYGYSNPATNHNKTCPTPGTQDYENWLKVNAAAFGALAAEVPEIKFFEPFNEINLTTTGFEKPGIPWDASDQVAANYKYSIEEKAGVMADLCWYISRAVKAVDPANQVTTPSICVGSHESIIEGTYLNALYNAIESGVYPTNNALGDIRVDNYFTLINIHAYPEYATTSSARTTKINNIASDIGSSIYSVMQAHHDGNSRVWLTETGVSVFGSRTEANAGDLMTKLLTKINTGATYIDTVIFYKVADASTSNGLSEPETKFGLFYAGDASSNRYAAKQTAKAVYKFFHNGSTDYTALNNLATNARNGAYSN